MFKETYTYYFPLTTTRRFVLDQVINWLSYILFYGGIILAVLSCTTIIFYNVGRLSVYFLGLPSPNIYTTAEIYFVTSAFGFLSLCGIAAVAIGIIAIVMILYYDDYSPWLTSQLTHIKELEEGIPDIEAEYIPVTTSRFHQYSYKLLPLGSLQRYLCRLFLYGLVVFGILSCHMYLSILVFPISNQPWLANWLTSTSIQFLVLGAMFLIYISVVPYCDDEWRKFKAQSERAVYKKNDYNTA